MIDTALGFILAELNTFLGARVHSSEPLAVLSHLANPDGTTPTGIENKLVLSLVNIEREAAAPALGIKGGGEHGQYSRRNPALNLNLSLLVCASFGNNYTEALRFLSIALSFFQARPNFTAQSSSAFPRELARLNIELVSLDTQALNNLWSILGAKYLPSALYKLRMLTLQDGIGEKIPAIRGASTQVGG